MGSYMQRRDEYAVIVVRGSIVREYTAKSQSVAAMNKQEFQRSKKDVLEYVEGCLGWRLGSCRSRGRQTGKSRPWMMVTKRTERFKSMTF